MTSPSLPVSVRRPLPCIRPASVAEHLAAHFGPGQAGSQADFIFLARPQFAELDDAQEFVGVFGRDVDFDLILAFFDHAARDLAADVGDLAFQIADAGFLRVVADDVAERFVGELQIFFGEAVGFALLFSPGSAWRFRAFPPRCSLGGAGFPCGPAEAAGWCAARWRCR